MRMDRLSHLMESRGLSPASSRGRLGCQTRGSMLFKIQDHHLHPQYPYRLGDLHRFHPHHPNPQGGYLGCSFKN